MDIEALKKYIKARANNGIGSASNEISQLREDNLDRYLGELYGYEEEGESQVVARDVLETIEWAMPSILRVFTSGGRYVEFQAEGAQDEQAAEIETDAVNNIFNLDNNGFTVFYTWFKSALLNPNAYVKVYWEDNEKATTETYENLSEDELAWLMEDPELEAIEKDATIIPEQQPDGSYQDVIVYDVKFKRTSKTGRLVVEPMPEEEVIVSGDHSKPSLEDVDCVIHKTKRTISYLVGEGYDRKKLEAIGDGDDDTSEERNRKFYSDENDDMDEFSTAERELTVYEAYPMIDWNDDGISERRRVVMIGNEIFENEEFDGVPIVAMAALLMPHKHTGMSLAELVKDLQEIRTAILRQLLNNMYKVNNPRTVVGAGVNLDDVLSNASNGIIRAQDVANIRTEPTTPVISHVIPMLQLLDEEQESRSGISRNSQALDANVLSQVNNGAYFEALEQANQRIEMIVRTFAETGVKDMFMKMHELLIKHGNSRELKLNGQWVQVNPQDWRGRIGMNVLVGLGFGGRDQKMAAATAITAAQQAYPMLVTPDNMYNAARLRVEATGEKAVDKYFTHPTQMPQQQPQPDPNMEAIKAQVQIEAGKDRTKQMEIAGKQQTDAQKLEIEAAKEARERAKLELEYTTDIPGGMNDEGPYSL